MTVDQKMKSAKFKNLEMSKGHTDVSQESSNGEEQVTQEHSQHVVQDHPTNTSKYKSINTR